MIYLDNAATTPVNSHIQSVVTEHLAQNFANPSADYRLGIQSEQVIDDAREQVANALCVQKKCVYFTSGGTEALHLAMAGLFFARRGFCKNIVQSGYEHAAVAQYLQLLAELHGIEIRTVPPERDGSLNPQRLTDAVDDGTGMVCVMQVNNETGAICDVAMLAQSIKAKNRRTAVMCDGVQGFLKLPPFLQASAVDAYVLSGHKFGAPKGIGALYLREGCNYTPVGVGGGQEKGLRSGTENIAYIAALGEAVQGLSSTVQQRFEQAARQKAVLQSALTLGGAIVNSPQYSSPYILNVSYEGTKSAVVQRALDYAGVIVSPGSACSRGKNSRTLMAMSLSTKRVEGALRLSFFESLSEEVLGNAANIILKTVTAQRQSTLSRRT